MRQNIVRLTAAVALACIPVMAFAGQRRPDQRVRTAIRREAREVLREASRIRERARSEVRRAWAQERRQVREVTRRARLEVAREHRRAQRELRRRWW